MKGRYGQICSFWDIFTPKSENAHKTLNNCENSLRKLSTKSSHGRYIKVDLFPGVFVMERVDMNRYVFWGACFAPKSENAHITLNKCGNSPKKLSTKSSHGRYIKIDSFPGCIC